MALRIDSSQNRSLYVGTSTQVAVSDGNAIVTGKVGIGTTTPQITLDVVTGGTVSVTPNAESSAVFRRNGNNYISILSNSSNEGGILFGNSTDNNDASISYGHNTQAMSFATADAERMRISSNGSVGIGTTNPLNKLTVQASNTGTQVTTIPVGKFINTGNAFSKLILGSNNSNFDGVVSMDNDSTLANTKLRIYIGNGTTATTGHSNDHIVLQGNGNVGIGTNDPDEKLVLYKNINYNSDSALFSAYAVNSTAVNNNEVFKWRTGITGNQSGHSLTFSTLARTQSSYVERMRITSVGNIEQGIVGTTASAYYYFNSTTTGDTGVIFRDNSSTNSGFLTYNHDTDSMKFGAGGSERMRITSTGNVGIGATSSNTFGGASKLFVDIGTGQGSIRLQNGNTDGVYFRRHTSGGNYQFQTYSSTNNTGVLSLQPFGGNVGIGDTTPLSKLEVAGSIKSTNYDTSHTSESGVTLGYNVTEAMAYLETWTSKPLTFRTYNYQAFNISGNEAMRIDTSRNVGIGITNPVSYGKFVVQGTGNLINANASSGAATFQLYEGGQGRFAITTLNGSAGAKFELAGNEKMRITATGKVGIGTTTPRSKLQVGTSATVGTGFSVPSAALFAGDSNVLHAQVGVFDNDTFAIDKGGSIDLGGLIGGTGSSPYPFARISGLKENSTSGNYAGYFEISTTPTGSLTDTPRLQINSTGSLKLHNYDGTNKTGTPTYILGTDASGNVVKVLGGDIPGGGGTVTGSGTATQVAFWNTNTSLSGNSELYWDNTNGCLGINDTTPTSRLKVAGTVSDTSIYTVDINHVRNNPDVATNAMRINVDLSGADNTTADRTNTGLLIDIDSSANGDSSNEHRIYGVNSTVNFTGFTDLARGGYFLAESNYTGAKTSQLVGAYGHAVHDASDTAGGVSNMYGVYGNSAIQDKGDVDNAFGAFGYVTIPNSRIEDVGVTKGVEGEVEINAETALNYGTMIGVSSVIDNNEGATPNFGAQYLFKGDYQGTKGANTYGIYTEGDKNYFSGNVGIGTTSTQGKMTVVGATQTINMDLDANAAIGLSVMGLDSGGTNAFTIGSANSQNNSGVVRFKYNSAGSANNYMGLGFYANDDILNVKADGNVGIGTTSPTAKLHLAVSSANDDTFHIFNGSVRTHLLASESTNGVIYMRSSANTNTVRINSSGLSYFNGGNVGIGTTNPGAKLDVAGSINTNGSINLTNAGVNTIAASNASNGYLRFLVDQQGVALTLNADKTSTFGGVIYAVDGNKGAPGISFANDTDTGIFRDSSDTLVIGTGGNARIIIQSNGEVGINQTNPSATLHLKALTTNGVPFKLEGNANTTVEQMLIITSKAFNSSDAWYNLVAQAGDGAGGATNTCIIERDGDLRNKNNSYGQISDSRLKENITDATPKLDDVMKVKVKNFNFIGEDLKQIGVVAQELEEVFPGLVKEDKQPDVNGEEGGIYKSVKYSVLVPILLKAMQEQQDQIEDLKTRITQLEN